MRTYFRVSIFALGSTNGEGGWEDYYVVRAKTPERAYLKALAYLASCGFAFSSHLELCDKNGELIP